MAESVAVSPHAVFETPRLKAPLAAKPAVILRAFSLAGLRSSRRYNDQGKTGAQNNSAVLHC
jgi:hypothetical protein